MSKRKKIAPWHERLDAAIKEKFNFETETRFSICSMNFYTTPADGETPLTDDITLFIAGFMAAEKGHL